MRSFGFFCHCYLISSIDFSVSIPFPFPHIVLLHPIDICEQQMVLPTRPDPDSDSGSTRTDSQLHGRLPPEAKHLRTVASKDRKMVADSSFLGNTMPLRRCVSFLPSIFGLHSTGSGKSSRARHCPPCHPATLALLLVCFGAYQPLDPAPYVAHVWTRRTSRRVALR